MRPKARQTQTTTTFRSPGAHLQAADGCASPCFSHLASPADYRIRRVLLKARALAAVPSVGRRSVRHPVRMTLSSICMRTSSSRHSVTQYACAMSIAAGGATRRGHAPEAPDVCSNLRPKPQGAQDLRQARGARAPGGAGRRQATGLLWRPRGARIWPRGAVGRAAGDQRTFDRKSISFRYTVRGR